MISRRNFFSLTLLMLALLFLCMSINNLKDSLNDYEVNRYTETAENYPSKVNMYVPDSFGDGDGDPSGVYDGETAVVPRNLVVCVGDGEAAALKAAAEWAAYTKRGLAKYPTLAYCGTAGDGGEPPEMLVIDPACVDWTSDRELDILDGWLGSGTHLVFCGLPDVSVVEGSQRVRELLGVRRVLERETTVGGFYLREGFLLGGAAFYMEQGDDGKPLPGSGAFPGERTLPWYLPAVGTKVYMKGVPEDDAVEAEDYPIVMWRRSTGSGYVFAVNGEFMEGPAGIGLLSAMSAEMHPYEIYPVVNAQSIILAGYPSLADENPEEMERLYSRPVRQVYQELLWPSMLGFLQRQGLRATCMMTPQYDYRDDNLPDGEQLQYYLKIFAEQSAETGLSGLNVSGTSLMEKLEADARFFQEAMGGYDFASFYAGGLGDGEIAQALETEVLSSAKTVVREYDGTKVSPVGFLTEDVTEQSVLGSGLEYTYQGDFLIRGMETALGYFSTSFDLSRVAYPDSDGDTWEQMSRTLAATISTYGQRYRGFARTTAAECDARIRQMLAMDYQESRTGNRVELKIEGVTGPVWFILRTHNEAIQDMEGGSWEKLEDGAYLVEAAQGEVTLTLGPADERHYR